MWRDFKDHFKNRYRNRGAGMTHHDFLDLPKLRNIKNNHNKTLNDMTQQKIRMLS